MFIRCVLEQHYTHQPLAHVAAYCTIAHIPQKTASEKVSVRAGASTWECSALTIFEYIVVSELCCCLNDYDAYMFLCKLVIWCQEITTKRIEALRVQEEWYEFALPSIMKGRYRYIPLPISKRRNGLVIRFTRMMRFHLLKKWKVHNGKKKLGSSLRSIHATSGEIAYAVPHPSYEHSLLSSSVEFHI